MEIKPNYFRKCPNETCVNEITYKRIGDMKVAIKNSRLCDDCRYYEINKRNEKIIYYLNHTELTHKKISEELNISLDIITHVRKKYNLDRGVKLSPNGKKIRSENFKKNILDKKLNTNGGTKSPEQYEKIFKSRYGYEYSEFLKTQPEFKKYYSKVRNITNKNLRKYKVLFNNLDKLGRCGDKGKYQVDHIFSVKEGFRQNIIPELIGHPSNLRVIKWEDNLSKSDSCETTINKLIDETSKFLTNNHKIIINFNNLI